MTKNSYLCRNFVVRMRPDVLRAALSYFFKYLSYP